ncbi:hypothetical protein D3C81_1773410 [compost metagenome]
MVYPAEPLTKLSAEDVEAIRKSVAGSQSWHAYEAYKKYREHLQAVHTERDQLLAALLAITYERDGRHYVGRQGDSDVTEEVGPAIAAAKGGAA